MFKATIADAVRRLRELACAHKYWYMLNDTEDQCHDCGMIATEEVRKSLESAKDSNE